MFVYCANIVFMPDIDGKKLLELRHRRVLSQRDLSEKAGIATSTLVYLEKSQREASFKTIRKLAAALGVEPEELVS